MYYATIKQFSKTLGNLDKIIDKAMQYAQSRNFDPNNFCTSRLAPDMFTFTKQVQVACDMAKGMAATLAGREAPKHEDTEKTLTELQARIRKCRDYLSEFKESDFKNLDPMTKLKMSYPQGKGMHAEEYFIARAIPNFYFHIVTAYALLRNGGVNLGKMDYLGDLHAFDM